MRLRIIGRGRKQSVGANVVIIYFKFLKIVVLVGIVCVGVDFL